MNAVAVIPARGGSQRIPRKNIKPFHGRPMIAWSIRCALASGLFDAVVVSTDDDEIAAVAKAEGAEVPFVRPAALADAFTGTAAVMRHALERLSAQGRDYDLACCLYATAPLLSVDDLRRGHEVLSVAPGKSYAFSVCGFGFPVQRALGLDEEGALTPLYPEYREVRSQDLPPAFQDAGQFYWGRSAAWQRGDVLFSPSSLPVMLPRHRVQDIDTEEDWQRAEWLFAALIASGELRP